MSASRQINIAYLNLPAGYLWATRGESGRDTTPIYSLNVTDPRVVTRRFHELVPILQHWHRLNSVPSTVGLIAEERCRRAISRTFAASYVHLPTAVLVDERVCRFDFKLALTQVPTTIPFKISTPLIIAVEVKNSRRWIYPSDLRLWVFLKHLLQSDVDFPIVVARKLPYVTYLFFKYIGAFGFSTHVQYVNASYRDLVNVRHKDGLGYKDIRIFSPHYEGTSVNARMERFWEYTVPLYATKCARRWRLVKPLISTLFRNVSPDKISAQQRRVLIAQLWTQLKTLPPEEYDVQPYYNMLREGQQERASARAEYEAGRERHYQRLDWKHDTYERGEWDDDNPWLNDTYMPGVGSGYEYDDWETYDEETDDESGTQGQNVKEDLRPADSTFFPGLDKFRE